MMKVKDIRKLFVDTYNVEPPRAGGTVELRGVSFVCDELEIFEGTRNEQYIRAEIAWYDSASPFVDDLAAHYGKRVKIWDDVADSLGKVNSNYGYCIYDTRRNCQYYNAVEALKKDPQSRQAIMIYQDPWMHKYAGKDFTCTNAVHYYMVPETFGSEEGWTVECVVQMRSNDAVYGFNNDLAWQRTVLRRLCTDLDYHYGKYVIPGEIIWQVGSLHVYPRHFHLLDKMEAELNA